MELFVTYLRDVEGELRRNKNWRAGQAYFNTLCNHRPDIAEKLRGSRVDPFHRNELIPVFLHHVASLW